MSKSVENFYDFETNWHQLLGSKISMDQENVTAHKLHFCSMTLSFSILSVHSPSLIIKPIGHQILVSIILSLRTRFRSIGHRKSFGQTKGKSTSVVLPHPHETRQNDTRDLIQWSATPYPGRNQSVKAKIFFLYIIFPVWAIGEGS